MPVSVLATGAYLTMFVASLSIGRGAEARIPRLAWESMLVLAGAAAGSAVWFTIVQKWMLGAFCAYCTGSHIIGLLFAALVVWKAPRRLARITPAFIGLVLAGILAVCQISFAPRALGRGGESQRPLAVMDPHEVPLIGSPEAPYVVKLLFDYKCSHCQQLHFMLNEAVRQYGSKLSFALCPTPLNPQCNPYIPRDTDEFNGSCELAKVGLAVWVANRKEFPTLENWMFSFESGDRWHPRTFDAAKAKAIELVGQVNFESAWRNPWIAEYMQKSIRVFADTHQTGNNAIPKLVFGSRWVIPEPHDAKDLVFILQNSLAVPRP